MSAQPRPAPAGDPPVVAAPLPAALSDGWIGTKELPGYRAGAVVVKLDRLPGVDADHLYLDVLLLDASGRTQDNHSGPCPALGREPSLDERSAFVRIVAELLRPALDDAPAVATLGQALNFLREQGVAPARLMSAAQLLDAASSETGVARSLRGVLVASLGEEEACAALRGALAKLPQPPADRRDGDDLCTLVTEWVRSVGKAQARKLLRQATDFALVPDADLLGI